MAFKTYRCYECSINSLSKEKILLKKIMIKQYKIMIVALKKNILDILNMGEKKPFNWNYKLKNIVTKLHLKIVQIWVSINKMMFLMLGKKFYLST